MQVPFRLTRDIIDGMGATGVEGVFRRCCEKTLCVMRANKEALLTIVEVCILSVSFYNFKRLHNLAPPEAGLNVSGFRS